MTNGRGRMVGEYAEDLVIRARQGCLSAREQQALERALQTSATLRMAHQVGRDCDEVAVVQAGDESLIARVSQRVASQGPPRTAARAMGRVTLLAAAVLLIGGAAVAWWVDSKSVGEPSTLHSSDPPMASASPVPDIGSSSPSVSASPRRMVGSDEELRKNRRVSSHPAASASARVAAPRVSPDRTMASMPSEATTEEASNRSEESLDAAALFHRASSARSAGDYVLSIGLFTKLQQQFPASAEARASYVSLGKLLLSGGRAAAADRQFSSYLAVGGPLTAEALVGRAESLAALGRSSEERRVWQRIQRDFPSSVYAGRAEQRLRHLDSTMSH